MDDPQWELEYLVHADGAFFALGHIRGHIETGGSADAVHLYFEDREGARWGPVPASIRANGSEWDTFIACGESMLLRGAVSCRLAVKRDGSSRLLPPIAIPVTGSDEQGNAPGLLSYWLGYGRRMITLLKKGQLSVLSGKLRRYLLPGGGRSIGKQAFDTWLGAHKRGNLVLIVDHGLGGGAGLYCRESVISHVASGDSVLVVSSEPVRGGYVLHLHNADGVSRRRIGDLAVLVHSDGLSHLADIIYNTAAHFFRPLALVALMIRLQGISGAKLHLLFHDYFSLCPSVFLLGADGRYCGVPDQDTCRRCLPGNHYLPLQHYARYDPVLWRQVWQCLLTLAETAVAFSDASADIIRKAWPEMDPSRLQVIPHQKKWRQRQLIPVSPQLNDADAIFSLHIGVVGQIGYHKGAQVVSSLAAAIKRRKLAIRITVIGVLEEDCDKEIVRQTGRYERNELEELIAASAVNVMLFPSIWPETFSYVVQELMAMQLPVACFDLGAPAERVRDYRAGLILDSDDPDIILDSLIAFHRRLYHSSDNHLP